MKVFNYSVLHFAKVTFYEIHTLMTGVHYSACSLCYKKNRPVSPKMFTHERLFTITRVHCTYIADRWIKCRNSKPRHATVKDGRK